MSDTKFVTYFLVCGLDTSTGLEVIEDDHRHHSNPLDRSYQPRILTHLPDITSWSHFNAEALSRLALPSGLKFCTDREISDASTIPKAHPFVLTKEDGEKSYGVSLIFYEEVKDLNICHAMHTLQKMFTTESEGGNHRTMRRSTDHSGTRERCRSAGTTKMAANERSRSLPRHYQQLSRLSDSTLDLSSASYDYRKDILYVTKSLSLICSQPLVSAASQILHAIVKYINKSDCDLQVLEGLIYNLLYDIPLPNNGRSVRFYCLGEAITLSTPQLPDELPVFDYDLLDFFDILGIDNAIKLFVCVLLEHQVLVYSSDFEKLMLVCESMTTLLYPFSWPHVYVPILPPSLENFLDAPVPYIMGLLRRTHDIELYKRGTVCIVDIDNGELELPEELPEFPSERDFIDEIQDTIIEFGGKAGANLLKEHALESRENLESSNQNITDNSDTMDQLNQMISKFESLSAKLKPVSQAPSCTPLSRLRLNNAIREVFVNRFANLFLSYEHFVIIPSEGDLLTMTPQQQETQQNFDKISFLSDQIQAYLPFLSGFLETQMFSTFIDDWITRTGSGSEWIGSFEVRVQALKEKFGDTLVRTPTYERCKTTEVTNEILMQRLKHVELTISPPKKQKHSKPSSSRGNKHITPGIFPVLEPSNFTSKDDNALTASAVFIKGGDRSSKLIDVSLLPAQKIIMMNPSPASIAETNWKFVNQLLKECKQKTKRILLEKLGQEAVEWGHGEIGFSGSEENMLVASICDLIERIWSHGLQNRQRKSALWHYLYKYGRQNEKILRFKGTLGTQAYCVSFLKSKPYVLSDYARPVQVVLDPRLSSPSFNSTLLAIMHNVSTIHEIKSEIGYSRAWIRLALEQKNLSIHLHALLSDANLLKSLYKRYAFLRCEDEREQSLYYLQTLNTVEFSCFTNAYTKSSLLYQVLIFPSQRSVGASTTTSNLWIHVVGSINETPYLFIPRNVIHFAFWAKNLGVITSLRIGHDNSGPSPTFLIDHILIRNEFTGQCFKFTCGRWLGQNIDDGSCERYMVGYQTPPDLGMPELVTSAASPPDIPCPATPMRTNDSEAIVIELQTMLGDSINRIIKFYHKNLKEKISYAHLMCGEYGLVHTLIWIFSFGFKSARLFGKNLFVWDFFLKVTMDFNQSIGGSTSTLASAGTNSPLSSPKKTLTLESPRRVASTGTLGKLGGSQTPSAGSPTNTLGKPVNATVLSRANQFRRMYTRLITRIETSCARLGKDDKFQLFVCLSVHDRLLGKIITDLTRAVAAQQLYDEASFLRDPTLTSFLSHILDALSDISVPVDPAMKKTLEQHNVVA